VDLPAGGALRLARVYGFRNIQTLLRQVMQCDVV
jgi:hypothetical protein